MEQDKDLEIVDLDVAGTAYGDNDFTETDDRVVVQLDGDQTVDKADELSDDRSKGAVIRQFLLSGGIDKHKVDVFLGKLHGEFKSYFYSFCAKNDKLRYRLLIAQNKQVYFAAIKGAKNTFFELPYSTYVAKYFHYADLDLLALSFIACHLPSASNKVMQTDIKYTLKALHYFISYGIDDLPDELVRIFTDSKAFIPESLHSHNFFSLLKFNQDERASSMKEYKEFLHRFDVDVSKYPSLAKPTSSQLLFLEWAYTRGARLEKLDELVWHVRNDKVFSNLALGCEVLCSLTKLIAPCGMPGAALATAMHCVLLDAAPHCEKIDHKVLDATSCWLVLNAPLKSYSPKILALLDGSIPTGKAGGEARNILDRAKKASKTTTTSSARSTPSTTQPIHTTTTTTTSTTARNATTTSGTTPPVRSTTTASTSTRSPTTTSGTTQPVQTTSTSTSTQRSPTTTGTTTKKDTKGPKK